MKLGDPPLRYVDVTFLEEWIHPITNQRCHFGQNARLATRLSEQLVNAGIAVSVRTGVIGTALVLAPETAAALSYDESKVDPEFLAPSRAGWRKTG
jgi:hypothetical protein